MSDKRIKRSRGIGFLMFFGLFWTAIVGSFDVFVGYSAYRQTKAESFPTVSGVILSSGISSHQSTDSDGHTTTQHKAEITFSYEVVGVSYTGDTYRFGAFSSSDRGHAEGVIARYPEGAEVEVHYNPADPSEAVLEVGIGAMQMFLFLFLTPFNLIMLWLWGVNIGAVRRMITRPPAGGVPIVMRGATTHVRLPRISPLTAAGAAALAVSFISIFIIAFGTGMDPPMWAVQVVWAAALGLAMLVYFWRTYLVGSGAKDLVIDDGAGMLSLPQTFGRKEDVIVAMAAVDAVEVRTITHHSSKGGTSYTYAPELSWRDEGGELQRDRLAEWHDEARAKAFVDWLRRRIAEHTRG
ncbi:MAG: DUF3592 domain-containing protein [Phycisphaerales bacterium]|nr:MAG: DUF3592 domain-containing protein [Phycisphaerales bacterium]